MKSEAWEGPRRSKRMRSAAELDPAAKANRETLRNSTRNRDMVHSETEMWGPGKLLGEDSTGRSGWASYWWPGNVLNWKCGGRCANGERRIEGCGLPPFRDKAAEGWGTLSAAAGLRGGPPRRRRNLIRRPAHRDKAADPEGAPTGHSFSRG